ncbi:MAG: TnpV protein [Bacilli bacterium]|nr:TnpV protein [Bacilli bacterium]
MNMTYKKIGNYILPNLVAPEEGKAKIGKYGIMRLQYLKENKMGTYEAMKMKGTLTSHLNEIEETSQKRIEVIMKDLLKQENITEELKATDQMKWIGLMNNIKNQAEEIVVRELIYS